MVKHEIKDGATRPVWAWVPAVASIFFSAATVCLTFLYLNAHDMAYHQSGVGPEYQLQPDLVHREELLGSVHWKVNILRVGAGLVPARIACAMRFILLRIIRAGTSPAPTNHQQTYSPMYSVRIMTVFVALILSAIAFRVGTRMMAWLSLIIGVIGLVSIPLFTMM